MTDLTPEERKLMWAAWRREGPAGPPLGTGE